MGYTHYWNYKASEIKDNEELRNKFSKASKQIADFTSFINANKAFKICGGLGKGKPILNESEVWLNGEAKNDLDHETFSIYWAEDNKGFCKTARKPYDLVVCFCLLTFKEIFPYNVFSFSSDGGPDEEEWQNAIEYYQNFTGKKALFE